MLLMAWDCMFYPSGGEGFGNPAAEAMAAGTPVVYSDYSSHSEFCQFGGLPVRCTYQPEIIHGIQRSVIDTGHAIKQLLLLRRNPQICKSLGTRGKLHMLQYGAIHMVDVWNKIFSDLMAKPLPIESNRIYGSTI
jgi:glycosyltransferase involved in cell wall biosynthesis